jgi:hypothetical protein
MSYIKVSDPAIMDLAGMHQIINVVNQHSDYLNVLINKFGNNYQPVWVDDNVVATHDIATQQIIYGKATITATSKTDSSIYNSGGKFYYKTVSFVNGVTFSSPPFIIATVNVPGSGTSTQNADFIVTTYSTTNSGFGLRAKRSGSTATYDGSSIVINWVAIGPR